MVGDLAELQEYPCSPLPKSSQEFFRTDLKGRRKELSPWPLLLLPTGRSGSVDGGDPIGYLLGQEDFIVVCQRETCGRILWYLFPDEGLAASFLEDSSRRRRTKYLED